MDGFSRMKSIRRKNLKNTIIKISVAVVAAIVVIALILIPFFNKKADTERVYSEVMTLIENDNYSEAYQKLESIVGSDYKDTTSLLYLCSSHMLYDEGNVIDAYKEIEKVDFANQTEEQNAKIKEYTEMLKAEYNESNKGSETVLDKTSDDNSQQIEKNDGNKDRTSDVKTAEEEFAYDDAESFEADDATISHGNNENNNENN